MPRLLSQNSDKKEEKQERKEKIFFTQRLTPFYGDLFMSFPHFLCPSFAMIINGDLSQGVYATVSVSGLLILDFGY